MNKGNCSLVRKPRGLLCAVVAGLLASTAGSASAQTKLLLSTFFPPAHPIYSQVMQPWAAEVEKATGGSIKIEFSPNSLAPPPGQLDLVGPYIGDSDFRCHDYHAAFGDDVAGGPEPIAI